MWVLQILPLPHITGRIYCRLRFALHHECAWIEFTICRQARYVQDELTDIRWANEIGTIQTANKPTSWDNVRTFARIAAQNHGQSLDLVQDQGCFCSWSRSSVTSHDCRLALRDRDRSGGATTASRMVAATGEHCDNLELSGFSIAY